MPSTQYYVYIMTDDQHSMLYTGRTGNLKKRVAAHRSGNGSVFVSWKKLTRLVYYEIVEDISTARLREKQIKRSPKKKRLSLIEGMNPEWEDLFCRLPGKKITTMDVKDIKDNNK